MHSNHYLTENSFEQFLNSLQTLEISASRQRLAYRGHRQVRPTWLELPDSAHYMKGLSTLIINIDQNIFSNITASEEGRP